MTSTKSLRTKTSLNLMDEHEEAENSINHDELPDTQVVTIKEKETFDKQYSTIAVRKLKGVKKH